MSRLPASNVFVLPHEGRFIVYAPVRGLVFSANAATVSLLRRCCETRDPSVLPASLSSVLGGGEWLFEEDPLAPAGDRPFRPTMVTLFLHNRCNLRCVYCYAEAGDRTNLEMPEEVWRAAIDVGFRNARDVGMPLELGFHGGGEPALGWDSLVQALTYAESLTRDYDKDMRLSLITNGTLRQEQIDMVADHFPAVVVSMDGPEDIQNAQRPYADGRGSYADVMRTIGGLTAAGVSVGIRATITAASVPRMTEIVDFLADETPCTNIVYEPVFGCGRRAGRCGEAPDPDLFAEHFIEAFHRAIDRGLTLRYSGARLMGRRLSFCGVAEDTLTVTPDGYLTACFEVCDASHSLASEFIYGKYDAATNDFTVDESKRRQLHGLIVSNKPYCDACFCRWHCAGDCPIRMRGADVDFQSPSPRCRMNQRIMKELLVTALTKGAPCTPAATTSS